METPKRMQLSYDALKSVIKCMSFEKRQEILRRIPQLRKTNELLPYSLKKVNFGYRNDIIEINNIEWVFGIRIRDSNVVPETTVLLLTQTTESCPECSKRICLELSPQEGYKKVFETYLKNGTKIDKLEICDIPNSLSDINSDTFKLKVKEMSLKLSDVEKVTQFVKYIDKESLKIVECHYFGDKRDIFKIPMIESCETVVFRRDIGCEWVPWDLIVVLKNLHVKCIGLNFQYHQVQKFISDCMESEMTKPVGSTFTIEIRDISKVDEFYDLLIKENGAVRTKVVKQSNHAKGVVMRMPNHVAEMVVYTGPKKSGNHYHTLELEIMPAGTSIATELNDLKI